MKIAEEQDEYPEKHFIGNVELIEYRDHATAQNITVRDYKDYYSAHTIIMRCIGLVFYEDDDKIFLLHEVTAMISPIDAEAKDKIELDFHIVVKGAIISRSVLAKDVKMAVTLL